MLPNLLYIFRLREFQWYSMAKMLTYIYAYQIEYRAFSANSIKLQCAVLSAELTSIKTWMIDAINNSVSSYQLNTVLKYAAAF